MSFQPIPRSTPEAQGIKSEFIQDFIEAVEQNIQFMHSFMLLRHGVVVAEGWWYPYRPEVPHMLFSLTKIFTSTSVGLAVADGLLSVDDPVIKFFPLDIPQKISPNLSAMKVHHLLTMSTGHLTETAECIMDECNPTKAFLELEVQNEPGTLFVYNSGASFMLAAIVQKLTGQTILEYLTSRIFEPLGIKDATWESHPNGVNFGGWGLNIRTEDIARFGQLYLQKGMWNGQQLIPASWVDDATSKHISTKPDEDTDWEQGYGYQFWCCKIPYSYRGEGAFGQFCIVMPDEDIVLAITAGSPEMQTILNIVREKLFPGIYAKELPSNNTPAENLRHILKNLRLLPPQGRFISPEAQGISGQVFRFKQNNGNLYSLKLDFNVNSLTYVLRNVGGRLSTHNLNFGVGTWVEGIATLNAFAPSKVTTSGVWISDNSFILTICQYEKPFMITLSFCVEDKEVNFVYQVNVSFSPLGPLQLIGKAN